MKTPETAPRRQLPELLAPAGTLEIAVAAFDAGADAVYAGLPRFNARERAGNFTLAELQRCIDFAHAKGRKLYVVFNTLLREEELPDAAAMLADLALAAPDAVIVQDLAVARMVKRYFPTLKLHASTQLGIHNLAGIRMAEKLGFQRVILERQLTLDEVAFLAKRTPLELETFIHGSLCCSLSGRCLFSSYLGGMSGNRGKCKQPCRRAYAFAGGNANLFSPRDLDGSKLLPELARLGIASLKIEGRLRGPEYVWKTVRAYRLLLDALPEIPPETADAAATLLRSTSTRRTSEGFFRCMDALIEAGKTGTFGVESASVERRLPDGRLLCRAVSRLHLGDRVRLTPPDGGEGESFSLTNLLPPNGNGKLLKVAPGTLFLLPGSHAAAPRWKLYKIGENGFDFSRTAAALSAGRTPLCLTLRASATRFSAAIAELPAFAWQSDTAFSPAEKHPVSAAEIARIWQEGVPEPWRADAVQVTVEGNFFAPGKLLKELRRDFWSKAAAALQDFDPASPFRASLAKWQTEYVKRCGANGDIPAVPPAAVPSFLAPSEEAKCARNVRELAYSSWRVNGLHAAELLQEKTGVKIGVFPLAVSNSEAAAAVQELGLAAAEAEPELDDAAFEALKAHSPIPVFRGREALPLLVSRLPLKPLHAPLTDAAGNRLILTGDPQEKLTLLMTEDEDPRRRFAKGNWK